MKPQQASTTAKLIAAALVLLASDPHTRGLVAPEAAAPPQSISKCKMPSLAETPVYGG